MAAISLTNPTSERFRSRPSGADVHVRPQRAVLPAVGPVGLPHGAAGSAPTAAARPSRRSRPDHLTLNRFPAFFDLGAPGNRAFKMLLVT